MSVTNQIPRKVSVAAAGATVFPYDFKVVSKFDLLVQVNGTTKTVDADYTVTGVGLDAGGDITFTTPLAGGETVMRKRNMAYERDTDYQNLGDLRSATLNNDQDAPIMMLQQLNEGFGRSLQLPLDSTGTGQLPALVPLAPLVVKADGQGFDMGSTTLTGDMLLRPNLAESAEGKGSDLVVVRDLTAPAYLKTVSDILNGLPVNVRRFFSQQDVFESMLDGSVTFDATAALQSALAAYGESQSRRGGRLDLGRGRFIVNDTLRPTSFATDNAVNLEIVGEGFLSTWLDFSAMTGGKDGIVVPGDQQIRFAGFFLKGGAGVRDGIHLGRNAADGGANENAVSVFDLSDIRVQGCARDGFHHYNSYMGTMARCYALANGRDGFHGQGFHTSLTHVTCYALDNVASGFNYNGIVYSTFVGCGSDLNQFGYVLSNARGVSFKSCGSEGNNQDGWLIFADQNTVDTSNPLMAQECYDVRGVSLENCSGYGNNQLNAGYAGLVRLVANNVHTGAGTFNDGSAHTVEVSIRDCDASNNPSGTKAIVAEQSLGGQVSYTESGRNYFPGGRLNGAGTLHVNDCVRGKTCLVQFVAQTVANATDVSATINTTPLKNDLGATITASTVAIPDGVNKVRVSANSAWAANAAGFRKLQLLKNGAGLTGAFSSFQPAVSGDFTIQNGVSAVVDVAPGDLFSVRLYQNSGGSLDTLSAANATWMSVEAIS